jgi:hypothetical protein
VTNKEDGRTASEQAWIQMAAYGCAYFTAIFAGALSGFLASLFPHPSQIFDDDIFFDGVTYGDALD